MTGVSLSGNITARWLEEQPEAIDCVEIAADGFFVRPSPYLAWLSTRASILVRAPSLSIGTPGALSPERLKSLAEVSTAARSQFIVHPLGFSASDQIRLRATVPVALTPASLQFVAEHVIRATESCGRPSLIEPIVSPLRVPGRLAETDFLQQLCHQARCRLLIDVTSLLVASRNHGYDPRSWLLGIPGDLIGAVRIGGSAQRHGRWRHDASGEIDEAAWALLGDVVARATPEVRVLGARSRPDGLDGLARELRRLRTIVGESPMAREPIAVERVDAAKPGPPPPTVNVAREPLLLPDGTVEPVRIAADVALFVLDDEGVFFSGQRNELTLFNTPATLVWCLLEQDLPVAEITDAYRTAFGLAEADAARHVGTILHQWFGLGYINRPGTSVGEEVPLTTALAQLLTNPSLRSQFRTSPHAVANALLVAREERDLFTQLNPDELDEQAEEIASLSHAPMETASSDVNVALDSGRDRPAHSGPSRRYRLLTTTFEIRAESADLGGRVHEALAHLECTNRTPDVVIDLRISESGGWIVLEDEAPFDEGLQPEGLVPVVKLLLREVAVDRHDFLISVHAGAVSFGDGCVLLPATAGSGKTTLTAALIRSGATYLSDEIAILEGDTLAVRPVPLALTIKDGSVQPLRPYYPEIEALTPHVREDHVRVRYLKPPAASVPGEDFVQPVKWIVFPRYDSATETTLLPLARPLALRKLLDESFVRFDCLDPDKVKSLVGLMRTVECFDLPMSSVGSAVELLRSLMLPLAPD